MGACFWYVACLLHAGPHFFFLLVVLHLGGWCSGPQPEAYNCILTVDCRVSKGSLQNPDHSFDCPKLHFMYTWAAWDGLQIVFQVGLH